MTFYMTHTATSEDVLIARSVITGDDAWQARKSDGRMWPAPAALGVRMRARHRLAVLAARALDARGKDGAFPADAAALGIGAPDLAAHGDDVPLVLRLDGQRLSIAIDRGAVLPPYLAETFATAVSTSGEDGKLPLSLTPEAVAIDLGNPAVMALIAGSAHASATAAAAPP